MSKKVRRTRGFRVRKLHWLRISGLLLLLAGGAVIPTSNQLSPLTRVSAQALAAELEVPIDHDQVLLDKLAELINEFETQAGGELSVSFKLLGSEVELRHNGDTKMKSASLYKLFVAHRALELVDAGQLSLDQVILDKTSLDECLVKAITISDNDCGAVLQRMINPSVANEVLAARGYTATDLSGVFPTTTSSDTNRLLESIYNGQFLSQQSNKYLLGLLKNQQVASRLPALLPPSVEVAHKTGDLKTVSHDVGIVYAHQPYALSVMVETPTLQPSAYHQALAQFSQEVYNLVERLES